MKYKQPKLNCMYCCSTQGVSNCVATVAGHLAWFRI